VIKLAAIALVGLAPVAAQTDLGWLDAVSRVGVVGFLALALYGLQKKWWVPGWAYRELNDRHDVLRQRFDKVVETALQSSRGVERTASVVEEAIRRGEQSGGR
jgi:hypothetical protein